jgi:hypothetical protein
VKDSVAVTAQPMLFSRGLLSDYRWHFAPDDLSSEDQGLIGGLFDLLHRVSYYQGSAREKNAFLLLPLRSGLYLLSFGESQRRDRQDRAICELMGLRFASESAAWVKANLSQVLQHWYGLCSFHDVTAPPASLNDALDSREGTQTGGALELDVSVLAALPTAAKPLRLGQLATVQNALERIKKLRRLPRMLLIEPLEPEERRRFGEFEALVSDEGIHKFPLEEGSKDPLSATGSPSLSAPIAQSRRTADPEYGTPKGKTFDKSSDRTSDKPKKADSSAEKALKKSLEQQEELMLRVKRLEQEVRVVRSSRIWAMLAFVLALLGAAAAGFSFLEVQKFKADQADMNQVILELKDRVGQQGAQLEKLREDFLTGKGNGGKGIPKAPQ